MNEENYAPLRRNVRLLGGLLGSIIAEAEGPEFLDQIEQIRLLSKSARSGDATDEAKLRDTLRDLDADQLVPVARAFSQFLNLANIADQHHSVSRPMNEALSATKTLAAVFGQLQAAGVDNQAIVDGVGALQIELVLTAHPTEITRRTLIHKYREIDTCLGQLELQGLTEREEENIFSRLRELITQIWYSYDFRQQRPTPVDEAKWGFAVLENSLWQAVPDFIRRLDSCLQQSCGVHLPLNAAPVSFVSWMGGDRDGNPNVTAKVTHEVLHLSRWMAADLYLRDINQLIDELSMNACNRSLKELAGGAREPYRAVLRPVRDLLRDTLAEISARIAGRGNADARILTHIDQLWQPLHRCYQSLLDCGMKAVANGSLLDLLRRLRCFGIHLVRHDIRQESGRHTQALSELTRYLDIGDYEHWHEAQKQDFLFQELQSKRPLIPHNWQPSEAVREVLDTCRVIAQQPPTALGGYVISMARQPSDVLAVHLLLKACGCHLNLPVAPLFETLDDLNRAPEVIEQLLSNDHYRQLIGERLMVMIGYSDSAKDAGVMAAAWAQYRAQEALLAVCNRAGIRLTLFHGRGGTVGRGGAPAHAALLSQPPGSLKSGLRVTEQGEMIRAKLGLPAIAIKTLALYTSAILQANLLEPPAPKPEWRAAMDQISDKACARYREVVRGEPRFVAYFRQATPEQELARLPLGSRPARRRDGGGIETLRAIPWIFAWSQNRLMLPAWLGAGAALQAVLDEGKGELLDEMMTQWPFFTARLSLLEMVFAKADIGLAAYYDSKLVEAELQPIGAALRRQLGRDINTLLNISGKDSLLEGQSWSAESIGLRNIYTDPLNVLQAELLSRYRNQEDPQVEQAIMVTIAGVAAGMRNTG